MKETKLGLDSASPQAPHADGQSIMNAFYDSIFFISGCRVLDGIDPYLLTEQSPTTLQAELPLPLTSSTEGIDAHGILSNPAKRVAYHLVLEARAMTPTRALVPSIHGWRRLVRACALILGAMSAEAKWEHSVAADLWQWALHEIMALTPVDLCRGMVRRRLLSLGLASHCHAAVVRQLCSAIASELMTIGMLRCGATHTGEPSPNVGVHARLLAALHRQRHTQTFISIVAEAVRVLADLRRERSSPVVCPELLQLLRKLEALPDLRVDFINRLLADGLLNQLDPAALHLVREAAGPHLGLLLHIRAAHTNVARATSDRNARIEHALCSVALCPPEPLRSELDVMIGELFREGASDPYFMLRYHSVQCSPLCAQLPGELRAALRNELARRITRTSHDQQSIDRAAALLDGIETAIAAGATGSALVSAVKVKGFWSGFASDDTLWSLIEGPMATVTSALDIERFVLSLPAPPNHFSTHEQLISSFEIVPVACNDSPALRGLDRNAYIASSIDWPSKVALVVGVGLLLRFVHGTIDEELNAWKCDGLHEEVRGISPEEDPLEVIDTTVKYFERRHGALDDAPGNEMRAAFDAAVHAGLQRCVARNRPELCFEVLEHSGEWIDGSQWLSVAIKTTNEVSFLRVLELVDDGDEAKARKLLKQRSRHVERFSPRSDEEKQP